MCVGGGDRRALLEVCLSGGRCAAGDDLIAALLPELLRLRDALFAFTVEAVEVGQAGGDQAQVLAGLLAVNLRGYVGHLRQRALFAPFEAVQAGDQVALFEFGW